MTTTARHRGFTLVETLVCAVIVAGLGVALLQSISAAGRASLIAREQAAALQIAETVIADVLTTPLGSLEDLALRDSPAGDAGATPFGPHRSATPRGSLPSLFAFHDRIEAPPQQRDGTPMPSLQGWAMGIQVRPLSPTTLGPLDTDTGLALVTVRVAKGDRILLERRTLRSLAWDASLPAPEQLP